MNNLKTFASQLEKPSFWLKNEMTKDHDCLLMREKNKNLWYLPCLSKIRNVWIRKGE